MYGKYFVTDKYPEYAAFLKVSFGDFIKLLNILYFGKISDGRYFLICYIYENTL